MAKVLYGPPYVPVSKREVVHEHAFNAAALDLYGDMETADEALYIVEWALQRNAELVGEETSRPGVWAMKMEASLWSPKVLIFYQFNDRQVFLIDIKVID